MDIKRFRSHRCPKKSKSALRARRYARAATRPGATVHNVEDQPQSQCSTCNQSVEYRERWLTKAGKKALMWTKIMTKCDTQIQISRWDPAQF